MGNNIEPTQGHYFTLRMKPKKVWDGITYCKITTIEPQKHIAYTYRGEATGEKTLACAGGIPADHNPHIPGDTFSDICTMRRRHG